MNDYLKARLENIKNNLLAHPVTQLGHTQRIIIAKKRKFELQSHVSSITHKTQTARRSGWKHD